MFVVIFTAVGRHGDIKVTERNCAPVDKKRILIYTLLFLLSILTVLRIVPFGITTLITVAVLLITDREIILKTDYCLLLTFVFFFVFSGNLGRISSVRGFLEEILSANTCLTAVATSQVISNVPAAALLAPFTENWQELLAGVNIGGLGTPVASLASLISLKLYMGSEESKTGKYMAVFMVYNIAGLVLLFVLNQII